MSGPSSSAIPVAVSKDVPKDAAPERIGPYELGRKIGQHGTVEWWHAQLATGAQGQAVLRVRRETSPTRHTHLDHFLQRAQNAAPIQHPGVIRVLGSERQGDLAWAALQPVDGATLASVMRLNASLSQPLPLGSVCELVADLLDALGAIHQTPNAEGRPLVHGGLEPRRIRLTQQGEVKLGGLARELDEPGTPGLYTSPEHLRREALEPRSDLFSVGLLLYELLTRARPFPGLSELDTRAALLYQPIPSPRERVPHLPAPLEGLVMELLARNRFTRPDSAIKLARRLRTVAQEAHLPTAVRATWLSPHWQRLVDGNLRTPLEVAIAAPPPPPTESRNPLRFVAWGAVVFGALGALFGLVELWQSMHPKDGRRDLTGGMQPIPGLVAPNTTIDYSQTGSTVPPTTGVSGATSTNPTPTPPRPKVTNTGYLTLVTNPPVEVFLKGRSLGKTPLFNAALPMGKHVLEFHFADGHKQPYPVTLKAGAHQQMRLDLK